MTDRVGMFPAASVAEVRRRHRHVRVIGAARSKQDVIAAIYRAVDAPSYAATNLDALADILGDLSWLPGGPITLAWLGSDAVPTAVQTPLLDLLRNVADGSAGSAHPLSIYRIDAD